MSTLAQRIDAERAAMEAAAAEAAEAAAKAAAMAVAPEVVAAAWALGVAVSEVRTVHETTDGLVIRTMDGVDYLLVPPDRPDGAGQVGVMFLRAPRLPSGFPVFVPRPAAAPGVPQSEPVSIDPTDVVRELDRRAEADVASLAARLPEDLVSVSEIDRRLATIETERAKWATRREEATTSATLREASEALKALDESELVLRNRRPALVARTRRDAEQAAEAREARENAARQAAIVASDDLMTEFMAWHERLDAVRAEAFAAGAGNLVAPDNPDAPLKGSRILAFHLADQLAHHLRTDWPRMVAGTWEWTA